MKKSIYTKPKVCKASKGWYVYFRYAGKLQRFKFGINYIKDLKEREIEANALAKALQRKLKKGWNPLVPELPELGDNMSLIESLNFALEKKSESISKKTYSGYKGTVKFITDAIDKLDLNLLNVKEVKRVHIKTIMSKAKSQRDWSNKAYNKHLNHLKAILSELIQWDIIETNPAHKIDNLQTEKTNANVPATPEEQQIIVDFLKNDHYSFYVFVAMIYHTGIRPWELLQVKLKDINFTKQEIRLPAEITKTSIERIVPINPYLYALLLSIGAEESNKEFNLFGSFRIPGRGNCGPKLDFIPGPTQLKRDTATKRWKRLIKDGLGIDVNLYSNKHAGADAKILAGVDLNSLQELYGHKSKLMTLKYAKKIKEVYRKDIIDNSPDF